jgi:hypothetical protein
MLRIERWPKSRFWAVFNDHELIAVVVYKKGAKASLLHQGHPRRPLPRMLRLSRLHARTSVSLRPRQEGTRQTQIRSLSRVRLQKVQSRLERRKRPFTRKSPMRPTKPDRSCPPRLKRGGLSIHRSALDFFRVRSKLNENFLSKLNWPVPRKPSNAGTCVTSHTNSW